MFAWINSVNAEASEARAVTTVEKWTETTQRFFGPGRSMQDQLKSRLDSWTSSHSPELRMGKRLTIAVGIPTALPRK